MCVFLIFLLTCLGGEASYTITNKEEGEKRRKKARPCECVFHCRTKDKQQETKPKKKIGEGRVERWEEKKKGGGLHTIDSYGVCNFTSHSPPVKMELCWLEGKEKIVWERRKEALEGAEHRNETQWEDTKGEKEGETGHFSFSSFVFLSVCVVCFGPSWANVCFCPLSPFLLSWRNNSSPTINKRKKNTEKKESVCLVFACLFLPCVSSFRFSCLALCLLMGKVRHGKTRNHNRWGSLEMNYFLQFG